MLSPTGLGQSMAQVGGCVGLAYYFPDKTALASGIAVSGAGFGSFVHPALAQLLIGEEGRFRQKCTSTNADVKV